MINGIKHPNAIYRGASIGVGSTEVQAGKITDFEKKNRSGHSNIENINKHRLITKPALFAFFIIYRIV